MKKIKYLYKKINKSKNLLINRLMNHSNFLYNMLYYFIIYKSLLKTFLYLIKYKYPREKILTAKSLINLIDSGSKDINTCHILCSGASALKTIHIIKPKNEYVMGLSFSCLLYPNPNIIFQEGANIKTRVDKLRNLILAKSIKEGKNIPIIWKNLSDAEIFPEIINKYFKFNNYFLIDYHLPYHELNYNYKNTLSIQKFVDSSYELGAPQYLNSVITLLGIASRKFKKIIIHGCDMGGEWFYDSKEFKIPTYLTKEELDVLREVHEESRLANCNRYTEGAINGYIGLQVIMPKLIHAFKRKGIDIQFAKDII